MTEAAKDKFNLEEALKEINEKLFEDSVAKAGGKIPDDLLDLVQMIHSIIQIHGYPPTIGLALLMFSTVPIMDGPPSPEKPSDEDTIKHALAGYEAVLRSFVGKREYWPYSDLKPQEGETVQ